MVTKSLGVEAFDVGLAVRSQGQHVVWDGRGADRDVSGPAGRAGGLSADTDAELALSLSPARKRLAAGQDALDLGDLTSVPTRIDDVASWAAGRCSDTGQPPLETASLAAPERTTGGRAGALPQVHVRSVLRGSVRRAVS